MGRLTPRTQDNDPLSCPVSCAFPLHAVTPFIIQSYSVCWEYIMFLQSIVISPRADTVLLWYSSQLLACAGLGWGTDHWLTCHCSLKQSAGDPESEHFPIRLGEDVPPWLLLTAPGMPLPVFSPSPRLWLPSSNFAHSGITLQEVFLLCALICQPFGLSNNYISHNNTRVPHSF